MSDSLFSPKHIIVLSKVDFINIFICPYIWYLKNVEKIKLPPTGSMLKGADLHNVMREINARKNLEESRKYISQQIESLRSFEKQLTNIINFLEMRKSNGDSVFPEYSEFRIEVLVENFKLVGIIDAIYNNTFGYEVFEYKKSFYKDIQSLLLETSFYSYIFSKYTNIKIARMGLFSFETGEVIYGPFDEKVVLDRIREAFKVILEGNFEPKPSYENCKFCSYKNFCRYSVVGK
ncbi:MAG: PD-(D/E)XK nuclease family protein [Spirochaetes bacterium]|nr:PD-(D/E)XK nuclease family protein [Spirochaetota bacterium]